MGSADLFASKSGVIRKVAWTFVRSTSVNMEIDDAVQVASIAAWKILRDERYKHLERVDGLIATAGYRALSDEIRSGRVTGIKRHGHAHGDQPPLSLNTPVVEEYGNLDYMDALVDRGDDEFDATDEQLRIGHAMGKLPDRLRFVVYLRFFEDLPMAQIGEILGIHESRVSQLLTSAYKHLRPLLAA